MADDGISVRLTSGLAAEALDALGEALRQDLVTALAREGTLYWDQEARQRLSTTGKAYAESIQAPDISPGMATIVLNGVLANRLENGWAAYDLHDTLLGDKVPVIERGQKGAKGKYRKKDGSGFYRAIPFRHTGPNSVGAEGAPVGSAYAKETGDDAAAKSMAKRVWAMAKKLSPTTEENGSVKWGGRLPMDVTPKLRDHHSGSIYGGMYRVERTYDNATQTTYRTFRTISTGSVGWRVDAKPGIHLAQATATYVSSIAQGVLDNLVEKMQEGS